MSAGELSDRPIEWYRCPVDRDVLKHLNSRSDLLALFHAGGFLTVLVGTGAVAWYSSIHWGVGATLSLVFLHGTVYAFQIVAVHELGHKTVFKNRALNSLFEHVFAFLGWINHRMFWSSHLRHHRFTLHPPDDLEVVLPAKLTLFAYLKTAVINPLALWHTVRHTFRIARGKFEGQWELICNPAEDLRRRAAAVAWARTLLLGHLLIVVISIYFRWWMLPVLTTLAPFYAGWLQFLCNALQHAGLQDKVPDFRLCCRTITLNPVLGFLYWNMNYHTEHHMYPGVPCYRLAQLHRAIHRDLPPTRNLFDAWLEVRDILRKQRENPGYQYVAPLPPSADAQITAAGTEPNPITAARDN